MRNFFRNDNDVNNVEAIKTLKNWVRLYGNFDDDAVITISEVNCLDENCPDMETQILVLEKENNYQFRIRKPLVFVRKWDIQTVIFLKK